MYSDPVELAKHLEDLDRRTRQLVLDLRMDRRARHQVAQQKTQSLEQFLLSHGYRLAKPGDLKQTYCFVRRAGEKRGSCIWVVKVQAS